MATMIGVWSGYSFIRTRAECYEISTDAANNRSLMRIDVWVDTTQWLAADSTTFYAYIAGVGTSWTRGYTNFNVGSTYIGTHDVWVGHDTNGAGSAAFAASHTGTFGGSSNTGTGYAPMTDFDRSPTKPSVSTRSRNVSGTSFSITGWSGGVNNSGPTVTWTLQRADNSLFSTNLVNVTSTTTSGTTLTSSSLDPNKTYYFRIRAQNSDGTKYSDTITSYGVPGPPTGLTVTPSTTDAGKVNLSWTAPSNTQGGITGYNIFVNDVYADTTTSTSFASIRANTSNGALVPGTSYTYKIASKNATNGSSTTLSDFASSTVTGSAVKAPGPPTAPTYGSNPNPPSKTGRNVTIAVSANADNINSNTPITGYYVQYRTATTSGGTYGAWSTPVQMSVSGENYVYTYNLLAPALWYKFRVYAKSSIINTVSPSTGAVTRSYYPDDSSSYTANFSAETEPLFVSSGGKRYDGTSWIPTETAKRYDGTSWVDITIAKRWDGTSWVDLT